MTEKQIAENRITDNNSTNNNSTNNNNAKNNKNKIKTKLYTSITILLWSTVFIFTKEGLKYYNAETLAVIRYIFSAVGLLVLIFAKKMKKPESKDIPVFIALGFLGFAFYVITFNKGMMTLNSSTSSVLLACSPIIATILSRIFLKEKISLWMASYICFIFRNSCTDFMGRCIQV